MADCKFNATQILKITKLAEQKRVSLIAFLELCLTSSTCEDLKKRQLLQAAEAEFLDILEKTKSLKIISVIGVPICCNSNIFNCAVMVYQGSILWVIPKINLS